MLEVCMANRTKVMANKENSQKIVFHSCDLNLDPMTLIYELDLDIMEMYLYAKNEVPSSKHSKVIARTHTHTHTHTLLKTLSSAFAGGNNNDNNNNKNNNINNKKAFQSKAHHPRITINQ